MAKALKYFFEFSDIDADDYKVEIWVEGFAGTATELIAGGNPLTRTYNKDVGEKYLGGIVPSVISIEAISNASFHAVDFTGQNYGDAVAVVYKNTVLQYNAIIVPFEGSDSDLNDGIYSVNLSAECGLVNLKTIPFLPSGTRKKLLDVIIQCINNIPYVNSFGYSVVDNVDLRDADLNKPYYYESFIEDNFFEGLSCYDVINSIIQQYGQFTFTDGRWDIKNIAEISKVNSVKRTYSNAGVLQSSTTYTRPDESVTRTAGGDFGLMFSQKSVTIEKTKSISRSLNSNADFENASGWTFEGFGAAIFEITNGYLTNLGNTLFNPEVDGSYAQSPPTTYFPFKSSFELTPKQELKIKFKSTKGSFIKNLRLQIIAVQDLDANFYYLTNEASWYRAVEGVGTPIYAANFKDGVEEVIPIPQVPFLLPDTPPVLSNVIPVYGEFMPFPYLDAVSNLPYKIYVRVFRPERLGDDIPAGLPALDLTTQIDYIHITAEEINNDSLNGFTKKFGVSTQKDRSGDLTIKLGVGYPSFPVAYDSLFFNGSTTKPITLYNSLPIEEFIADSYLSVLSQRQKFYQGTVIANIEFGDLLDIDGEKHRIHNYEYNYKLKQANIKTIGLGVNADTIEELPVYESDVNLDIDSILNQVDIDMNRKYGDNLNLKFVDKNIQINTLADGQKSLSLRQDFRISRLYSDDVFLRTASDGSIQDVAEDTEGNFTLIKPAKDGTYALLEDIEDLAWLQEGNTATVATKKLGTLDNFDFNIIRNNVNIGQIKSTGLDLLDNRLDVGAVQYNVATVQTVGVAKTIWNDTFGTLEFGLKGGNINYRLGQSSIVYVKSADNAGLTKGTVVYTAGSDGINKTVRLAQANAESTSSKTFGIIAETVTGGEKAFCTTFGNLEGINTSAFAEGATIYLSPTVAGGLTTTKPSAPNHMVVVGFCIRSHATQGVIFVKVQNGFEIDELHDVAIGTLANNNLLAYEAGTSLWKNKTFAELGLSSGTGTTNFVTKWSNATGGLIDSQIFDNGLNVGIGTPTPTAKLEINQDANATGLLVTGGSSGLDMARFVRDIGGDVTVGINGSGGDAQMYFTTTGNTFAIGTDGSSFKISDSAVVGTNDRLTIDSIGNVGIGTTNPYGKFTTRNTYTDGSNSTHYVLDLNSATTGDSASIDFNGSNINLGSSPPSVRLKFTRLGAGAIGGFAIGTRNTANVLVDRLYIDHNNGVGINTNTPDTYNQGGSGSFLTFAGTTPRMNIVASDTNLALISGGNETIRRGGIAFTNGSNIEFSTNTSNSGTNIGTKMIVLANGNIGIGTTTPTQKLDVAGGARFTNDVIIGGGAVGVNSLIASKNITGGADASGIRSSGQIQSDVMNSAYFFRAVVNQANFALPTLIVYESQVGTISGTGTTIANFRAQANPASFTNVYGFQSLIASGTNRYGIYNNGTAQNHFRGNVGIGAGSTVPTTELDVLGITRTTNLRITNGAAVGKVWQCNNVNGTGEWVTPLSSERYIGEWAANSGVAPSASPTTGDYYVVNTAGTYLGITYAAGDEIYWNGTAWLKRSNFLTLPIATASVLGGIKIGTGLAIDGSGVVSVASSPILTTARTISATGDGTWSVSFNGSADVSGALTLANVATEGTYQSVTVNAKGLVTAGTNPTTLAGYGITDAYTKTESDGRYQGLDADLTSIAALTGTTGVLRKTAANSWSLDTNTFVNSGNLIDFIATTSQVGFVAIGTTMEVNGFGVINQKSGLVTANTYRSVTVDTYGRITAGTNPTTISGYGITDAYTKTESDARFVITSVFYGDPTWIASLAWTKLTGVPTTFAPSAHTLDSHSNVTITSNSAGELLRWNGTAWINSTLAESGIQPLDADLTAIAALAGTSGILRKTAANTWSLDTASYFTTPTGLTTNYVSKWGGSAFANSQIFDNGTRVGIGTVSPQQKLDIVDGTGIYFRHTEIANTSGAFRVFLGSYTGNGMTGLMANAINGNNQLQFGGGTLLAEPATRLLFYTGAYGSLGAGTERMRIDSSGFVGINTFSPAYTLDVSGNIRTTNLLITSGATSGSFLKCNNVNGTSVWSSITAADIVSGVIATARLASGTASATTFLRGDQTWATLPAPTLTSTRIGFGSGSNLLTSSANFVFEDDRVIAIKEGTISKMEVARYVGSSNYGLYVHGGNLELKIMSGAGSVVSQSNHNFLGRILLNNLPGDAGQVLTSQGSGANPTWTTVSGGTQDLDDVLGVGNTAINKQIILNGTNSVLDSAAIMFYRNGVEKGKLYYDNQFLTLDRLRLTSTSKIQIESSVSVGLYGTSAIIGSLSGTGTRMVVADASGVLSTQAIPSGGIGTIDQVLAAGNTSTEKTFNFQNTDTNAYLNFKNNSGTLKGQILHLPSFNIIEFSSTTGNKLQLKSGSDLDLLGSNINVGYPYSNGFVKINGTPFKLAYSDFWAGTYTPALGDKVLFSYDSDKNAFVMQKIQVYTSPIDSKNYLVI